MNTVKNNISRFISVDGKQLKVKEGAKCFPKSNVFIWQF